MKQYNLALPAALMMMVSSCANDEFSPADGVETTVTFSISIDDTETMSRAFADGSLTERLDYAVYDGDNLLEAYTTTFENQSANIKLQLVNNRSYKVAFFAHSGDKDSDDNVYVFDANNHKITVNYENMVGYNEVDYDCFFHLEEINDVNGPAQRSISLTRPLAQINWGTNDLSKLGEEASTIKTSATYTGVGNELDMLTGEITGNTTITFAEAGRPAETEKYPVGDETYSYLAMHYLLAPAGQPLLVDATLTPTGNHSARTVTALPIMANSRSNIYGSLFTSTQDVEIEIDKDFLTVSNQEELQNALSQSKSARIGDSFSISNSISLENVSGEVVIDLNGKELSGSFEIVNAYDATLQIKDSKGGGKISSRVKQNNGKLIINSGEFTEGVDANNLEINGGEFTIISDEDIALIKVTGETTINNGRFISMHTLVETSKCNVTINGGLFKTTGQCAMFFGAQFAINDGKFFVHKSGIIHFYENTAVSKNYISIHGGIWQEGNDSVSYLLPRGYEAIPYEGDAGEDKYDDQKVYEVVPIS